MRVEITEKVAKEVFMGDFRNLPIERINVRNKLSEKNF